MNYVLAWRPLSLVGPFDSADQMVPFALSGPWFDAWNQRSAPFVVSAPTGDLETATALRTMEVPMTMHSDRHTTHAPNNSLSDPTWLLLGLLLAGAIALWYFS